MSSKITWHLLRQLRKVWVRVASFAVLAIVTAGVAQLVAPLIPSAWTVKIGADSVDQVLSIVASSMLAVTTFSLAIAISAFSAAASTATPRATALLQEDPTAQNVLATFLGAFLFSLVGIIALQAGYYDSAGRLVLFVATAAVIALVVLALLRWISHLMTFGRMGDTLDRVEAAAITSLENRLNNPFLGGRPITAGIPNTCLPVLSCEAGYVLHVDVGKLDTVAESLKVKVWLNALPGSFVHQAVPLLHVEREINDDEALQRLRTAFTIGAERSFEQDPRFGLIVISEIASRALSPAVNDPGTAISVVGRLVRILARWKDNPDAKIDHRSVFVPGIEAADVIVDAFRPIVRDGASSVEVQLRVQKALHALAEIAPDVFAEPASDMAADALSRAQKALTESEYRLLEQVSAVKLRQDTRHEPS
ncbi:hypothetical protein TG4357_03817 [Thalassovita gelatinovora]|uniref:DUF2254 domain-containing protein n=1 Tax=Thalassovita gelatinovora TaxID=53501 RepID=A0A0P1FLR6_THAGE|nr:DUF2254 domain-containing protein [Thalassovita gelatinovora]QIZ79138.1 DUF2254 domain-containing protein [Thalassovita gelatinovora]CUH68806.1 hypothetical protein TG4357_03817 [Thalassovita gelatinovora]SEQ59152.1 Uncharacterized membrane protein [Thalassovita gelatinovora]